MTGPRATEARSAGTGRSRRRVLVGLARTAVGLLIPLGDLLRPARVGVDVYVALLVSTLMSAAPTVVGLFRRRVNALSAYFTTMVLGSVVVVPGSRQQRVPAGQGGGADLRHRCLVLGQCVHPASAGPSVLPTTAGRPVPVAVGLGPMVGALAAWRRMWRVFSVLWGLGSIADAVLRVVFAYALPADVVPALATALWALTTVGLIVVTNVF